MVEVALHPIPGLLDIRINQQDISEVTAYLAGRISYVKDFAKGLFLHKKLTFQGTEDIYDLRKKLIEKKVSKKPGFLAVEGTFFPCLLLYSGWWERQGKVKVPELVWQDNLQEWLFHGFEQWGPSWDISLSAKEAISPYIFAQLGAGDEVNSIPVIIPGEKAKAVRQNILGGQMVFEAEVKGLLYHRSHLPKPLFTSLGQWGKAFDYCILLNEDDEQHTISRRLDKTATFSAYLWQCWGPKQWLKDKKMPRLDEVYFVWEHTDFTKQDAIAYNLDSLQRKADYIQSKHGDLALLQKSTSIVPGEPLCPTELFYNFLLGGLKGNG